MHFSLEDFGIDSLSQSGRNTSFGELDHERLVIFLQQFLSNMDSLIYESLLFINSNLSKRYIKLVEFSS